MDEWIWDVDNSKFSSTFNYFDGRASGDDVVRSIDAFSKYISQDIIELIVDQTNIYRKYRYIQKGKNTTVWKEIDTDEIYAFLEILLIMGLHQLSTDRNLFTPAVTNVMRRNEFQRIFSNIHLANNMKISSRNMSNRHKLYKRTHLSALENSKKICWIYS